MRSSRIDHCSSCDVSIPYSGLCIDCTRLLGNQRLNKKLDEEMKAKIGEMEKRLQKAKDEEDSAKPVEPKGTWKEMVEIIKTVMPAGTSFDELEKMLDFEPDPNAKKAPSKTERKTLREGSFAVGTKVRLAPEFFYCVTDAPAEFVEKVTYELGSAAHEDFEIVSAIRKDHGLDIEIRNKNGQWVKGLSEKDIIWVAV